MVGEFMEILPEEIGSISSYLLESFRENGIGCFGDLLGLMGQRYYLSGLSDFVEFEWRPSNLNTLAYAISYIRPGTGIPLGARINPVLDYSQMIIKSVGLIGGYDPFMEDHLGNILQNKVIPTSQFDALIEEFEQLEKLKGTIH